MLQYKVLYKKGPENGVADALSRRSHDSSQLQAISTIAPSWMDKMVQGYTNDTQAQELITQLTIAPTAKPNFTLVNGVIKNKGKIWLRSNVQLQQKVTTALHDSAIGGHSGFPVTYHGIKQYFVWPGMKTSVLQYVQQCQICEQAKPDRSRYPGLLQPLPIPEQCWHTVSMDFIEGLPRSGSANCGQQTAS